MQVQRKPLLQPGDATTGCVLIHHETDNNMHNPCRDLSAASQITGLGCGLWSDAISHASHGFCALPMDFHIHMIVNIGPFDNSMQIFEYLSTLLAPGSRFYVTSCLVVSYSQRALSLVCQPLC
jgi:hypothetical protein